MIRIFLAAIFVASAYCDSKVFHESPFKKTVDYEEVIVFTVYSNITDEKNITTFDRDLTDDGCEENGTYAIITHGWKESISTPWVRDTIKNLLFHRGGCVIFMDYSKLASAEYFSLTPHFYDIAKVLLKKVMQIGNYERMFLYGFSFGARLVLEVGAQIGNQSIDRIDACEPAGPGFDGSGKTTDPKNAAKVVGCINTSVDKGTSRYNCHQNFRMGICGRMQLAAGPYPLGSHGLCPYFYNSAFTNKFYAQKRHQCQTQQEAKNLPSGYIMGYMREMAPVFGDIFIPTSRKYPYTERPKVRGPTKISNQIKSDKFDYENLDEINLQDYEN